MWRLTWICAAIALLAGCASLTPIDQKKVDAFLADKPKEMHPLLTRLVAEGERNRVLNQMRAGLAAMDLGHDDLAAKMFDEALLTIETIYADNEKAKQARGMFSAEDRKVFRGEPYERAMAYYYRGILYLMKGDYENARASFKSGFLQDTLAEKEKYRGDFALLAFLEGWASQCNGNPDLAKEAYALAKKLNSRLVVPNPGDNTLVLADLGYAPVKYSVGKHGEALKIKSNKQKAPESAAWMDGVTRNLPNSESILWQAMTRGGREFDAVLANKVVFKKSAAEGARAGAAVAAGATALAQMQAATGNYDAARISTGVGALGALFSLAASAASAATRTTADTRQWDNLPEKVAYGAYRDDNAASRPAIKFGAASANARPTRHGGDKRCVVAWARPKSGSSGAGVWARVAGKTFSGKQSGRTNHGSPYSIPSRLSFSLTDEVLVTWSGGIFSSGSLLGKWRVEDGRVRIKYSQPPNIDATGLIEFHDDILVMHQVNINSYVGGRKDRSTWRLREDPEKE